MPADPDVIELVEAVEDVLDPFEDDTPLVCGLENPAICESCT